MAWIVVELGAASRNLGLELNWGQVLRALGIRTLALLLAAPVVARTPPWVLRSCTASRTYSDGTEWSIRRLKKGAVLTVIKPNWFLPKGQTTELYLHFGGGGFGHPRNVTATKTPGKTGLTFPLDDDLLLAFKVMNGVKVRRRGVDLTDWLELEGSSQAYTKLGRCRAP